MKYTPRYIATRAAALRVGLQLSNAEWRCVQAAAKDCHLRTAEYVRLMVLAAAGMGGHVAVGVSRAEVVRDDVGRSDNARSHGRAAEHAEAARKESPRRRAEEEEGMSAANKTSAISQDEAWGAADVAEREHCWLAAQRANSANGTAHVRDILIRERYAAAKEAVQRERERIISAVANREAQLHNARMYLSADDVADIVRSER